MSNRVIVQIASMPIDFNRRGDVSMVELLAESGYLDEEPQTETKALSAFFQDKPHYIDTWPQYSEDQRCTPSFFLSAPSISQHNWLVGEIDSNAKLVGEKTFLTGGEACAEFVTTIIGELQRIHERGSKKQTK